MTAYRPPPADVSPVVFADDWLIVADKAPGLLSVPGRGEGMDDCLTSRVQAEFPDALTVHRLDMSTSGLLVLARGPEIHRQLSKMFRDREVDKRYVAVVYGRMAEASGEVDLPLICDWPNRPRQKVDHEIGKASLTRYRVLSEEGGNTRVELEPVTGRSHQLRVHMAALGHPMLGDDLYGGPAEKLAPRLLLHAMDLAFVHPVSGQRLEFHADAAF